MCATVAVVDARCIEVEERVVAVDRMDAEGPGTTGAVDRTVEILECDETSVLTSVEHIAEILVAIVEHAVVVLDGIAIAVDDVVHDIVDTVDEVEVDLVAVIVLHWGEVELVGHTVTQESCIAADVAH